MCTKGERMSAKAPTMCAKAAHVSAMSPAISVKFAQGDIAKWTIPRLQTFHPALYPTSPPCPR